MFQDRPIKRTLLLHLILLCNCRPTTTLHSGTHTRSRELNLRPGFASTEDYFSSRHDLHQAVGPSALSKPLPQKLTKDSIFFFASDQRSPIDSGLLNSSPVGACCRARAFSTNRRPGMNSRGPDRSRESGTDAEKIRVFGEFLEERFGEERARGLSDNCPISSISKCINRIS